MSANCEMLCSMPTILIHVSIMNQSSRPSTNDKSVSFFCSILCSFICSLSVPSSINAHSHNSALPTYEFFLNNSTQQNKSVIFKNNNAYEIVPVNKKAQCQNKMTRFDKTVGQIPFQYTVQQKTTSNHNTAITGTG